MYKRQPQEQHGPVSDVLCNILLVIFMAQIIINFVVFGATWNAMAGEGIDAYLDGSVSLGSPVQMLSMFSNLLFVAMLVLLILDIIKISNQKYKITGLVLFAIFLRPGYYIWRAHVLKRKMTFPIIYTIAYSLSLIHIWQTVEQISLEHILLETDCPYMAPEPHRGTRNDSSNLSYVAARIAEIKGVSVQEVEQTTWENACRVFGVR